MARVRAKSGEPSFDTALFGDAKPGHLPTGRVLVTKFLFRTQDDETVGEFVEEGGPVQLRFRHARREDRGRVVGNTIAVGDGRGKDVRGVTRRFTEPGRRSFARWIGGGQTGKGNGWGGRHFI
jgi:hypothetical protein